MSFRINKPIRRDGIESKGNYRDYRNDLRKDFFYRCGYCDSFDLRRANDFEIDHFVPQRVFNKFKPNDYSNLVYSCKSCNRSKSGKWITDKEDVNLLNNLGFIDPCDEEYEKHFIRHNNGDINWNSETGKWMYRELSLFNIQHSVIWMLENIRNAISECKAIIEIKGESEILKDCLLALFLIEENYLNKLFNDR